MVEFVCLLQDTFFSNEKKIFQTAGIYNKYEVYYYNKILLFFIFFQREEITFTEFFLLIFRNSNSFLTIYS